MIVVDSTVLADLLVGEERFMRRAKRLAILDADWIAPSIWRYEFGNILWKLGKFGNFDEDHIRLVLIEAGSFLIETVEELDREAVWNDAWASGLTYYDAAYVWLARMRGVALYTRTRRFCRWEEMSLGRCRTCRDFSRNRVENARVCGLKH